MVTTSPSARSTFQASGVWVRKTDVQSPPHETNAARSDSVRSARSATATESSRIRSSSPGMSAARTPACTPNASASPAASAARPGTARTPRTRPAAPTAHSTAAAGAMKRGNPA